MPSDLTIHLVRHGESKANLDKTLNARLPDHRVSLSERGHDQALAAGVALARVLGSLGGVAAYVSPYLRTRQTWAGMRHGMSECLGPDSGIGAMPVKESIHLRELEFGLFDGIPDEELAQEHPVAHRHYQKFKEFEGEFYARMPSGESRCDVAQRVHQFFGTLLRDHERHGVRQAIIVSHGVTTRAFAMMWMGLPVEWMEAEPNPGNCSIRSIHGKSWVAGSTDGYVLGGPHRRHSEAQEAREDGKVA